MALTVVHLLKRDLDPSRTMISRYALGPYGWVMAFCFAAWAAASASLSWALAPIAPSMLGRIGEMCLLAGSIGLTMAAVFPMDPVGTPRSEVSFSGRMHGVAFMLGLPCLGVAPLILSLALRGEPSHAALPLLPLTATIWLAAAVMFVVAARVGKDHGPNPHVPRPFGWANRLLMIAHVVWLIVAAWPMAP